MRPDQLPVLGELVYRHAGLKLDHMRQEDIFSTVDLMKATAGVSSFSELTQRLETMSTHHPLWQMLLRRVTVGETYFFRNASQFQALRDEIFPEIIEQRRKQGFKHLNIWSAGCASGEEPYSIAILLRELLPDIDQWSINLLGTDINTIALETARNGIYREHSFRSETRPDVQNRYFRQIERSYELDPAIRRMVTFAPLNLITDHYPSFLSRTTHLDVIICRNVTIYFDEPTTREVVSRFHQALLDKGWLIVGHAEPLASVYQGFAARNFEGTVVYQKVAIEPAQEETAFWGAKPALLPVVAPPVPSPIKSELSAPKPPRPEPVVPKESKREPAASTSSQPTLAMVKAAADREDWKTAIGLLHQMERAYALNPAYHYWRGLVLMHMEQLEEARQALRRSLYCDSKFAMSHYTLGEISSQAGNMREARRCWQQSLEALSDKQSESHVLQDDTLTVGELRELLLTRLDTSAR